jgi:hypothetical protein
MEESCSYSLLPGEKKIKPKSLLASMGLIFDCRRDSIIFLFGH